MSRGLLANLVVACMATLGATRAVPAWAEPARREIVILPPRGETGDAALEAWKVVVAEFSAAKAHLHGSLALHDRSRDFLVGPAREMNRDCGDRPKCLAEIGRAIGADVVVAETIARERVSMMAVDVATGAVLARSAVEAAAPETAPSERIRSAARQLLPSLAKKAPSPEKPSQPAVAKATPLPPAPKRATPRGAPPKIEAIATTTTTTHAREPKHGARTSDASAPVAVPPRVDTLPPKSALPGEIAIAKTQLFAPRGTRVPKEREDERALRDTSWWTWALLAAAAAVGAGSAVALLGAPGAGLNSTGSPSDRTGSIRGTY